MLSWTSGSPDHLGPLLEMWVSSTSGSPHGHLGPLLDIQTVSWTPGSSPERPSWSSPSSRPTLGGAAQDFFGVAQGGGGPTALVSPVVTYPDVLQCVTVGLVSNDECQRIYPGSVTPNMLCAGNPEGGRDTCQVPPGG